jgi:hypothetical protein
VLFNFGIQDKNRSLRSCGAGVPLAPLKEGLAGFALYTTPKKPAGETPALLNTGRDISVRIGNVRKCGR